jgi:hypothetical protein
MSVWMDGPQNVFGLGGGYLRHAVSETAVSVFTWNMPIWAQEIKLVSVSGHKKQQ